MKTVQVGRFKVGDAHPPVFMAEIGTFFNQDIDLGMQYVKQIKDAGADIVKGEILNNPDICLKDDTNAAYFTHKKGLVEENYRDLIERKIVSFDDYRTIFSRCKELEMDFVLSVYDFEGADFAVEIGASALKIATSNLVHSPLIRYVAGLGKPVILDTGKSTIEEISRSMQWLKDAGCEDVIMEHSPAAMPAPLTEHHLKMIPTLKEIFGKPVGLSDHHGGEEMMYAAVALGANVIEKPVCEDPTKPDQDFYWAMPISDLNAAVHRCKNIYEALGSNMRHIAMPRVPPTYRMGLVAKKDVDPSMEVNLDTVGFAFPAKGIPVESWDLVNGKNFAATLKAGSIVSFKDVDFS